MKILPQNPARRPHISIVSDCRGLIAAMAWMAPVVHASTPGLSPEKLEFFESKIRPVLATECYECHGAEKQKGGLRLDYKAGWEKGGDSGPSILPGNPKDSLLLQSVRHEDPDLKMPSKAPKLSPEAIAHLEKWVAMGAPDPREKPEPISGSTWSLKLAERRKWWSFQPVRDGKKGAFAGSRSVARHSSEAASFRADGPDSEPNRTFRVSTDCGPAWA
ncbi:MAG: hypothetical protein RLZZ253_2934 [Verrucomicrobiota bacterium]